MRRSTRNMALARVQRCSVWWGVLVFDVAAETMEGVSPGPQTVVIKFESTEAAKAWYESAEYQAVVGKRLSPPKVSRFVTEHERGLETQS